VRSEELGANGLNIWKKLFRKNTEENKNDGLSWRQQAAKHDKPDVWFTIGMMFKDGHLVSQDHQEASRMFAKAADSGHTLSQLELGHHYFKGLGVIQSNEKALKLYRQAAENGNANASFNIGLMYWKGEGVETDLSSARQWLEKAQSLGNPRAEGVLFLIGEQQRIFMEDALLQAATLSGWNAGIQGALGDFQKRSDGLGSDGISENPKDETMLAKKDHQKKQFSDLSTDRPLPNEYSPEMVSTSALGRIVGIKAKPFLFDEFLSRGYIERSDNRYWLTNLGRSVEVGGSNKPRLDGKEVVGWPTFLGASLHPLKQAFLDRVDFRLFHMTHIDNLMSILEHGIFSHNTAPNYLDISNPDVNSRRERADPIHKKSLHEYVPLYFNPRNAMLYEKQAEYRSDIVVLEVARRVCLSNYTLFTERNAAANGCRFAYCLSDVRKFDWPNIQCRNWIKNGFVNVDIKQLMMSECLVYGNIDNEDLAAIHTVNTSVSSRLQSMLASVQHPSIHSSPGLFF